MTGRVDGGGDEAQAEEVAEQLSDYVEEVEEYLAQTGSLDRSVAAKEEEE